MLCRLCDKIFRGREENLPVALPLSAASPDYYQWHSAVYRPKDSDIVEARIQDIQKNIHVIKAKYLDRKWHPDVQVLFWRYIKDE